MRQMGAHEDPAAARLFRHKQRILQLWEERVRAQVPTAGQVDTPALQDSLPELLDLLVSTLRHPRADDALEQEDKALAAKHGSERAQWETYSLDQVIFEYQLLREVLLEVLDAEQSLSLPARERVFDLILLAVRTASAQFAQLRDAQKRRAHEELERRVKERVAQLRLSEERFRHMVETVKDYAIFVIDPEGYITTWNAGCARMKGYSSEEAIGAHYSLLYPEEGRRRDEPMAHLRAARLEGRFRGEGMRRRKSGELFLADVSITAVYEDGKLVGFTKVVQDLTERNLLMQERDLSRSDADALRIEAEYRERFVATLTHDLRSPLAAAKVSAELITRAPSDTDKVRTWAHRIVEAVERTDRMISDLLDASSLHAGEPLRLEFERADLSQLAREVCDELSSRHGAKFALHTEGSTSGCWSLAGLRRVLDNLLSNAVKYSEQGAPITVRILQRDERILLTVHNLGPPIAAEDQHQLFRPFHRSLLAQASGQRGWGLGLTVVKGIVEAHRGMVKVESYPNDGTTFTVDLPVDARGARQQAQPSASP